MFSVLIITSCGEFIFWSYLVFVFVLTSFMSALHKLESLERRKPQSREISPDLAVVKPEGYCPN